MCSDDLEEQWLRVRSFLEEAVVLGEARILEMAEAPPSANAAAAPIGEFFPCMRWSETPGDGVSAARWSASAVAA